MKRIIQAVVVATIFTGAARAEDAAIVLPAQWTYADQHAAEIAAGPVVDAFPGSARDDTIVVAPSKSTYADGHASDVAKSMGDAFPGFARDDTITVPSMSTYADQFANERNMQARGESDPALAR